MAGAGVRRRYAPQVEVMAARFSGRRYGGPPGEVVAHQLDDARVLRLSRRDAHEAPLGHHLAELFWRLGLDNDSCDLGIACPRDEPIDRLGASKHRTAWDIRLARGSDAAELDAYDRAPSETHTFDLPAGSRLDLPPGPRLQQRCRRCGLGELGIPPLGVVAHDGPGSVTSVSSRWAMSFTPPITIRPLRFSIREIDAF